GSPGRLDATTRAAHRPHVARSGGGDHLVLVRDERGRGCPAQTEGPVRGELVELEVDGGVPQVRAHRSVTARGGDPDEGAVLAGRNVGEVEDAGPGVLVGSQ